MTVAGLLGAIGGAVVGLATVEEAHRATGLVRLSGIAGITASGPLDTYAADLESALQAAPVRDQVRRALGTDFEADVVEVERLRDASQVRIALEADSAETARTALLAAGRAGYAMLVEQQVQLLVVRERAAATRLQALEQQVAAARGAAVDTPPAGAVAAAAAVRQAQRLRSSAMGDLSQVQGQLAVGGDLQANVATTSAVVVDAVDPVSRLPQLLLLVAAGAVGGAVPGAALGAVLRRRGSGPTPRRPDRPRRTRVSKQLRRRGSPPAEGAHGRRSDVTPTGPLREPVDELPAR